MNKFTTSALLIALSAAMTLSCKKDEKKADEATTAPAASKVTAGTNAEALKTAAEAKPADLSEVFKACWAGYQERNEAALSSCYDETSEFEMVDYTPPVAATGVANIMPLIKQFWSSSSDEKAAPQLVLRNGTSFAALLLMTGTNDGEMMGRPATGKPYSYYGAQLVSFGPEGKIVKDSHWVDQGVVAHQLGLQPSERAPDSETAWPEPVWITAADDDAEKANLELAKAMNDAMMKGDVPGYMSQVADDISFRYIGDKEPMNGMEAYKKGFEMWANMADRQSERTALWAAGDWVVAVNDTSATLKMDMPGTKDTKGKSVKSTTMEFMQIADGKLKSHWVVENSMVYPVQLGLMDMANKDAEAGK